MACRTSGAKDSEPRLEWCCRAGSPASCAGRPFPPRSSSAGDMRVPDIVRARAGLTSICFGTRSPALPPGEIRAKARPLILSLGSISTTRLKNRRPIVVARFDRLVAAPIQVRRLASVARTRPAGTLPSSSAGVDRDPRKGRTNTRTPDGDAGSRTAASSSRAPPTASSR